MKRDKLKFAVEKLKEQAHKHYRGAWPSTYALGQDLARLREALPTGEWAEFVRADLKMSPEWGRRLMRVAATFTLAEFEEHRATKLEAVLRYGGNTREGALAVLHDPSKTRAAMERRRCGPTVRKTAHPLVETVGRSAEQLTDDFQALPLADKLAFIRAAQETVRAEVEQSMQPARRSVEKVVLMTGRRGLGR